MKKLVILLSFIIGISILGFYNTTSNQDDFYGRIEMIGSKNWTGNTVNGVYSQMVGVKTNGKTKYVTIGGSKDESELLDKSNIGDSVKISYKDIDFYNVTIIK